MVMERTLGLDTNSCDSADCASVDVGVSNAIVANMEMDSGDEVEREHAHPIRYSIIVSYLFILYYHIATLYIQRACHNG